MSGGGGGCSRFKQNAWKKEMCSNCYKTKDEHQDRPRPALPDLPLIPASQGILKGWDRDRKKKRKSVSFPMEECEVIGYGGEELSSEDEVDFEEIPSSREESSEEHEGEDDKALKKLTKNNTDFNSVLVNLSGGKPVQTMLLGNQKKDTIQVTVQPFNNNLANSRKLHLNKLLQDNTPSLTIIPCEKKEDSPPKEVETRKVNITRGSIITKNHESVKNKLYIQNMLNSKNEKRNSYSLMQEKVYITTTAKVSEEEKDENVDYINGKSKNLVVLNCNGVSLLGMESDKDKVLESRELAGEPDGKADSDEAELPVTPPPRISFLHRESPEIKRVTETFENKRITTIETLHEIKRTIEPIDRRMTPSPETRLNELVEIRRLSIGENENRISEITLTNVPETYEFRKKDTAERRIEVNERRTSENSNVVRRVEPASRRLSDSSEIRRSAEMIDERRFSDIPDSWKGDMDRRNSNSPEEVVRCKRQAPKPPQNESESEVESDVKAESDAGSVCCERTMLRIDPAETTPVLIRPVRPETLKISISSEESTTPSSSPEPDKSEGPYEIRRNSPKREPPPLPPTTPEPRKSPPEPLPRHNKTTFMDVEKKKTKMKETIKKLLRFGTKEEMEVEVQSPRVRPQIIHPLDLNKSAVQVLPSANMVKCETPTPTAPAAPTLPIGRPNKPPPPPRSESLNLMERLKSKPGTENNIYANLGEARSGMTPVKPIRTGSMRETGGKLTPVIVKEPAAPPPQSKEFVQELNVVTNMEQRVTTAGVTCLDQDNLYEAIGSANSAPECDMAHQTYYGSETESDTYSALNRQEAASGEGRKGSAIIPYSSAEENLAALSQLNLQAINHLLTKILERDKNGASLGMYNVDVSSRKEICRAAFIQGDKKREDPLMRGPCNRVTLAITQSESTLILPLSVPVVAKFTDNLPSDLLLPHFSSSINEVTVIACSEASRLSDGQSEEIDADESTEQKLLVLLQVLQIIGQISSRKCNLDNFILLKDSRKQYSVSYIHQQGTSETDENWKSSVERLCDSYSIAEPLRQRLSSCQTDSEATLAVTCWLYGPPSTMNREALPSWLALQRAFALRTYFAKSDLASTQHLIFLASNFDLNKLYDESRRLQQPTEL